MMNSMSENNNKKLQEPQEVGNFVLADNNNSEDDHRRPDNSMVEEDDFSVSFTEDDILSPLSPFDDMMDIKTCNVCQDVLCNGDHGSATNKNVVGNVTPILEKENILGSTTTASGSAGHKRRSTTEQSISSDCSSSNASSSIKKKKVKKSAAGHGTFVPKLFSALNKFTGSYPEVATWSEDGNKFLIMDESEFSNLYHSWNLSSSNDFAYIKKQLKIYGFHVDTVLINQHESSHLECSNPNFVKDKPALLKNIKSCRNTKNVSVQQMIDEALYPLKAEIFKLQERIAFLEQRTSACHNYSHQPNGLAWTSAPKNQPVPILHDSAIVTSDTEISVSEEGEMSEEDESCHSSKYYDKKNQATEKESDPFPSREEDDEYKESLLDVKTIVHFLLFSALLSEGLRRILM